MTQPQHSTSGHTQAPRPSAISKLYSGEGSSPKDHALASSFFSEQDAISRVCDLRAALERALSAEGRHAQQNIMIWGPPGVGKTQLIKELCDAYGARCVTLMLNMLEPTDLKGLPVPNRDTGRVDYLLMSELPPSDSQDLWVLFFDELNTATTETLNAAMRLILERRVDSYRLPPRTVIVAAGNRQTDRALVETLPSPLSNRFLHLNYLPLISEWCAWARGVGVLELIIDFIERNGELLIKTSSVERGWPSPRAWVRLSDQLRLAGMGALSDRRQLLLIAQGCVGVEASALLVDFAVNYTQRVDPRGFLLDPHVPLLITDERPDLRMTFLREVALYVTERLNTPSPHGEELLDGLLERLLTLPETEGRLLIGLLAADLSGEAHAALTGHERFPALLERYGLLGLKELSVGAPLEFLSVKSGLSPAARDLLRSCLKEAM